MPNATNWTVELGPSRGLTYTPISGPTANLPISSTSAFRKAPAPTVKTDVDSDPAGIEATGVSLKPKSIAESGREKIISIKAGSRHFFSDTATVYLTFLVHNNFLPW